MIASARAALVTMKDDRASSVQVNALDLSLDDSERLHERGTMRDETSIKVHKADELTKFSLRSGLGELMNS